MIYGGMDIRLWRPIPALAIYWAGGLLVLIFIFGKIAGLHVPMWSLGWFFLYLILPCGLGWLFSQALVEGRRLHVVVSAWAKHAFHGRHLVGGYRRAAAPRPVRSTRIRVESYYQTRRPLPVVPVLSGGLGVAVLVAVVLTVLGGSGSRSVPATAAAVPPTPTPAVYAPTVPPTLAHASTRAVRRAAVRSALPPLRRRTAAPLPREGMVSVARRFANAYLAYQIGQDGPSVRTALRATCTPGFAALLSGSPVGAPYASFHVDAVRYQPPTLVLVRFSNRKGQHGTLHVHVQAVAAGWQVAGLS